jgi:predicted Zn-dependent protease
MLRFVENDQELALVIGHELAHNAMGHIGAKTTNYVLGSVFDILAAAYGVNTQGAFGNAGAQAYSQGLEAEADYVGLYAVARADMPIDDSANFWRRFGAATGSIKTQYGASHPGSAERFVGIENAIVEIKAKQANGEALVPNRKGK